MDNLQLRQRIVRSMIRVGERTNNMRKPEKFEYRKHMTAAFMDMLELCIEANRARGQRRVELQNKMDTKLDVLRSLVDTAVSPEDRLISPGLHEVWSKELNEIGRMLEQRHERGRVLPQRQQLPFQRQHEHRLPLRSCLVCLCPAGYGLAGAQRQKGRISRPTRPKMNARAVCR